MDEREMSTAEAAMEYAAADEEAAADVGTTEDSTVEEITEEAITSAADEERAPTSVPDYAEIIESDLRALRAAYPELGGIKSITELENPLRYAQLRDLGLTPKEAYLATSGSRRRTDNRAHLFSAVPRSAGSPTSNMTHVELAGARELFPGLGDAELHGLYKRVTV